jgi:hypothetical protein
MPAQALSSSERLSTMSEERVIHLGVLHGVAEVLSSLPSVLKGGSALIFGYQQQRYTEDLDYNASKFFRLDAKIGTALAHLKASLHRIVVDKETTTGARYVVTYGKGPIQARSFKIETSFREAIIEDQVVTRNGLRLYTINTLAAQKLQAMRADKGGRTVARDLEDIRFIAERYAVDVDASIKHRIGDLVADGGGALAQRYRMAYVLSQDVTEKDLDKSIASLVDFRERFPDAPEASS